MAAGNYGNLAAVKGKVIYQKFPATGSSPDDKGSLKYFDIEKREEKNILDNVDNYSVSFNMQKMLVQRGTNFAVVSPSENQKFEKPLRLNEMEMMVDPAVEWKELFTDAWRMERDYFYIPGMPGLNGNSGKER